MKTVQKKRALALVEIIIVAFVVFLIGGYVIFYSEGKLREARRTQCVGNLKQIGLATQQYTSSFYFGEFMRASHGPRITPQQMVNDIQLLWGNGCGLMSDGKIFVCPAAPRSAAMYARSGQPLNADPSVGTLQYSLSDRTELSDPYNKIIMADMPSSLHSGVSTYHDSHFLFTVGMPNQLQNCLYLDSHVGWRQGANPTDDADSGGIYLDDPVIDGGSDTFIQFLHTEAQMVRSD